MAQMTYRQVGDYKIPNLTLPAEENVTLGKYGMMRKKFLMENRKVYFTNLVSRGILMRTLKETEMQAQEMLEQLTEQMMKTQGVTEQMKETDIVKAIMKYLRTVPGCFCWKEHGGMYGTAGIPDIIACIVASILCGRNKGTTLLSSQFLHS